MDTGDYQKHYAAQYGDGSGWFERVLVAARRARVLSTLEKFQPRSVLELGCGLEPLARHWPHAARYTVVEPVAEFAAAARAASPTGADTVVIEGFAEARSAELAARRPFDVIVVSSLLHEVPDPAALLATVHALSDADTVAHVNVPNVRSFHRLLALEMGLIGDVFEQSSTEAKFQRHTRYDRARFIGALEAAGFVVNHFETYFVKPFTHAQMESIFDSGILPRTAIDALGEMAKYLPELGAEMYAELRVRVDADL